MAINYIIKMVEHDFIKDNWSEIEREIRKAFVQSTFNDGYTIESPLQYTWDAVNKPFRQGLKHIVALNLEDKLLGCWFCIPTYRYESETGCDVGWFFTSSTLSPIEQVKIADKIVERMHEEMRKAGFKQVITDMGTQAGAKFLSKRHGYIHSPLEENTNRWVKNL